MSDILSAIRSNKSAAQIADFWLSGGFYKLEGLATGANTDFLLSQGGVNNQIRQFKPGLEYILTNGNVSTLGLTANGVSIGKAAPGSGVTVDFTGGGVASRAFRLQADNTGGNFSGMYYGALFNGNTVTYGYISAINNSATADAALTSIRFYATQNVVIGNIADNSGGKLQIDGNVVPSTTNTRTLGTSSFVWNELYINAASYTTGGRDLLVLNQTTKRLEKTASVPVTSVDYGNGVIDTAGNGQPEGVVTASPSSTYRQKDGTPGTMFWGKQSGTGNTGWVPVW